MIIIGGILVLFIHTARLSTKEIFSPSNKIHREVGRAKDLSAFLYYLSCGRLSGYVAWCQARVMFRSFKIFCYDEKSLLQYQ
jgi:hypothetical protein